MTDGYDPYDDEDLGQRDAPADDMIEESMDAIWEELRATCASVPPHVTFSISAETILMVLETTRALRGLATRYERDMQYLKSALAIAIKQRDNAQNELDRIRAVRR